MSCAQVAGMGGMTTAGLVAMRSSCPRNPPGSQTGANKRKTSKEGYGAEVLKPGPHDVLLGRGGGTNNHTGNINFRRLVNEHKMRYLACSKIEKPNVAREVVELWKKLDPPGRFLSRKEDKKKDGENDQVVWIEVPEKKAREKASQCLRERTPDVVPYIRQLREQQDQMTEQGVSMVQQQLKMQREAEAQKNSLHGMAAAAASYSRRNSMAEHNPYQQANPMAAMSNGGADFGARRGSMPMMQGGGGNMMNPMQQQQQQQQQQQAFNRRVSAPHLSGNNHSHAGLPAGLPTNAAAMMGQMGQFGGGAGMMEPGFIGSDNMYDPSYASSMTAMQLQQHHQQQLQLQQLQQQQLQLQHQMQMQQQHMAANMQAAHMQANMRAPRNMMGGMDAPQQWNMQPVGMGPNNQGLGNQSGHGNGNQLNHSGSSHSNRRNMKDGSSSHRGSARGARPRVPDAPPKSGPPADVEPLSPPKPDNNTSAGIATALPRDASPVRHHDPLQMPASAHGSTKKQRKQQPPAPKIAAPVDTTPLPPSRTMANPPVVVTPIDPPAGDEDDCPLPLNADGSDDEVGIEEYRKTLESYMVNHNMTTQTPIYYSDEDDLSVESFPEWPDVGDHPERDTKPRRRAREAPDARKVDRHKSNQSMMSVESRKTFKSNATSLSGLSMLSDMMSMESGKLSREEKMGASKRFSSNASIMSELTDISHTIDGLGLDDDI